MEPHVDWASPAALWHQFRGPASEPQRRVFRTPAIFRFASDAYMQELIDQMQTHPHRVADRLARPETWTQRVADAAPIVPKRGLIGKLERARAAAVQKVEAQQLALVRAGGWNAAAADSALKLFHPAAQRYYVIAASLICRTLGLPDHPVNTTQQEKVSFVMRMLDGASELAFVHGAWQPAAGNALLPGEEQNLMSPLTYVEDDGRRRRMYNGVIPVAKREAYLGAGRPKAGTDPAPIDPRQIALKLKVIGPWSSLTDVAAAPNAQKEHSTDSANLAPANQQIQAISWFLLMDLDAWLEQYLNPVWRAVHEGAPLNDPSQIDAFNQLIGLADSTVSLRDALVAIRQHRDEIESAQPPYQAGIGWPAFKFAEATQTGAGGLADANKRKTFEDTMVAALPADLPSSVPVPAIGRINSSTQISPLFVARCVYERPICGTVTPLLSEPTAPFQLASFFDADAPARPIRVEMPADTTPAGLRKFDKNTSFVMSDVLCGQVSALRSMTFGDLVRSVLPFPFHKDLGSGGGNIGPCTDGGMVCSLSIPIITICALVLLMIIVKLLDLVFFWMPFFQICLPTNFKAKG